MQAVQFSEHGRADVLQLVDVPTPQPRAGEVLIKVATAGVNYEARQTQGKVVLLF